MRPTVVGVEGEIQGDVFRERGQAVALVNVSVMPESVMAWMWIVCPQPAAAANDARYQ